MFNKVYPSVNQPENSPLLKAIKASDTNTIKSLVKGNPDSTYNEISKILKEHKEVHSLVLRGPNFYRKPCV
jgi:hypothetical protein